MTQTPRRKKGPRKAATDASKLPDDVLAEFELDDAGPDLVRLNKFLADRGVDSRRKCDELIQGGKVSVDGRVVSELGSKVDPDRQTVEVDGVLFKPGLTRKRYYLLNKPRGVVCTNERRELRPRAIDLITDPGKGRIYTVGRLDEDSEGLILLTNDGDFTNLVTHPRHGVPKTYQVKIRGAVEREALDTLRSGVRLAEGRTAGARVHVIKRNRSFTRMNVTIREGKNREVRRMFAALGFKVMRLQRTRIGTLADRKLKLGDWRPLKRGEIEALQELALDPAASEALLGHRPAGSEVAPQRWTSRSGKVARDRKTGKKVFRPDAKKPARPKSSVWDAARDVRSSSKPADSKPRGPKRSHPGRAGPGRAGPGSAGRSRR